MGVKQRKSMRVK